MPGGGSSASTYTRRPASKTPDETNGPEDPTFRHDIMRRHGGWWVLGHG